MMSRKSQQSGPPSLPTDKADGLGLALPPPDAVIALRVVGVDLELPLSIEQRAFLLGSQRRDKSADPEKEQFIRVSSNFLREGAPGKELVSKTHLLIEREGNRLWIRDQKSTNKTFVNECVEQEAPIKAGEAFRIGDVTLLAIDESMRALRPYLEWVLGLTAHAAVDRALQVIASDAPLLMLGDAGCEQLRLAQEIHRTSKRKSFGFATIEATMEGRAEQVGHLVLADRGTAFLDLATTTKLPAFFVGHLFGDTYRVRPIVTAPDIEVAAKHLGRENVSRLAVVHIPPIRRRLADVPALLDAYLRRLADARQRAGAENPRRHSVSELSKAKLDRLKAFHWPDNFPDLERNAARIDAFIEHGGNARATARALGVSPSALRDALKRIGLID